MDPSRLFSALAGVELADLEIYVVGGAVRDALLGRTPHDCDYVAVGTTAETLLARGFQQVGADFPVFLHPLSHAEVALARTERKTAAGHRGFVVHADPQVTLAEDLKRRDFTINAMALGLDGTLIDPYGGADDLGQRLLRHVSTAFTEDPLRVLRGCRFLAQLGEFSFRLASETLSLCQSMQGELKSLSNERVVQEISRLFASDDPTPGVHALSETGVLAALAPEMEVLPSQFQMTTETLRLVEWALAQQPSLDCLDSVLARFRFSQHLVTRMRAATWLQSTPATADAEVRLDVMTALGWLRGSPPDPVLDHDLVALGALGRFPIPIDRWLTQRAAVRAIDVQALAATGLQGARLGSALKSARVKVLSTEISAPGTAPGL